MRYVFDHDLHIHSKFSQCSSHPEQIPEKMLEYAKKNGLKQLCITDHFWDNKVKSELGIGLYGDLDMSFLKQVLPFPEDSEVEFLLGCECDMDKFYTVGVSKETIDELDFVVIPLTHLIWKGVTIEEDDFTVEGRARVWERRLDALLHKDLPWHKIGLAHLSSRMIGGEDDEYLKTLDAIRTDKMYELFEKAAKLGVGIELNRDGMKFPDELADTYLRMFRIAKECGCKFYIGSDSHNPTGFAEAKPTFERAIDLLGLTEDDKFHIIK